MSDSKEPAISKETAIEQLGEDGLFAMYCARVLADSQAEDILVIDLRGVSQVTDFFIIGTSTSERRMSSIAAELKLLAKDQNQSVFGIHDGQEIAWTVVDMVNVVTHIMSYEQRAFYDLESLWADGKRLMWSDYSVPGQFNYLTAGKNGGATV